MSARDLSALTRVPEPICANFLRIASAAAAPSHSTTRGVTHEAEDFGYFGDLVNEEVAVAGTGVDYDVLFSLILNYVSF